MRIPQLEQQVQQRPVGTPYSNVKATPDAFGGAVGEGLQHVGAELRQTSQVAAGIYREEKEKAQNAKLFGLYARFDEWEQPNLYHPEKGFLALRGEAAMGKPGEKPAADLKLEDFDKFAKDLSGTLSDDEERQAFGKVVEQKRSSVYREMSSHERREREGVEERNYKGALGKALGDALTAYRNGDQEGFQAFRRLAEGAIALRHKGAKEGEFDLRNWRTQMHLGVLKQLTDPDNGDPAAAAAYLKQNGPEIDGATREESGVDGRVEKAGLRTRSTGAADNIRAQLGNLSDSERLATAMGLAAKITDASLRDATSARLQEMYGVDKAAKAEGMKQRFGRVRSAIEKAGGVLDETTENFQLLDDDGKADAQAHARNIRYQIGLGTPAERAAIDEDSKIAKQNFLEEAAKNPELATTFEIADKYRRASPVARAEIAVFQAKLRRDIKEGKLATRTQFADHVKQVTAQLSPEKAKAVSAAIWELWNTGTDTRPTQAEIRKHTSDVLRTYVTHEGIIYDTKKPGYLLTPEQRAKAKPVYEPGETIPVGAPASQSFDVGEPTHVEGIDDAVLPQVIEAATNQGLDATNPQVLKTLHDNAMRKP